MVERKHECGAHAYLHENTIEAECVRVYGLPQRARRTYGLASFSANEARARGYYVSTVGVNKDVFLRTYIEQQEEPDIIEDKASR